jgi:flagellar motor switch/type III secretory pathway protein FliN
MTGRAGHQSVRIELGRQWLWSEGVVRLDAGSIIPLDCPAEELVELHVDGHVLARGEAVVVAGKLGIRIREVAANGPADWADERIGSA